VITLTLEDGIPLKRTLLFLSLTDAGIPYKSPEELIMPELADLGYIN
jgi:hypothetical protein